MAGQRKSRNGCSSAEGFSVFDRSTWADVGVLDVSRPDAMANLELWAPLSPPLPTRDAGVSPRTRRKRGSCLSLEHNDSTSPKKSTRPPPPVVGARVWDDGSLGYVPGIQFMSRARERERSDNTGLRGIVSGFSDQSRRRVSRFLSTVRRDAVAYSMMLSCPGRWLPEWNATAKDFFLRLLKQMTSSRDPLISETGVFWKQELQKREAIHFHFILWCLDEASAKHVQEWVARRWNVMVCRGMHPSDSAKHLAVHLHATNLFVIPPERFNYFAKYLGKDTEAALMRDPIPGRWWGKINSAFIPVSAVEETPLPPSVSVFAQRVARKIRQVKANAAKHRAVSRAAGLVDAHGNPLFSQFEVLNRKHRGRLGFLDDIMHFTGQRFGRCNLDPHLKMSAVYLAGPTAPATVKRILIYAFARESEDFDGIPY